MLSIKIIKGEKEFDSVTYEKTYLMWKETWIEEYKTLDKKAEIPSDNFTRQDQILSMFLGQECVAMTFLHGVDLSTIAGRDDSYFKVWPTDIIDSLCKINPHALVCSAFTVSKKFRGQKYKGVSFAELIAAASVQYLMNSDYKLMVGNMRNTRGANHIVSKVGAQLLRTIECNGEPSDLVVFLPNEIPKFNPNMKQILQDAYENLSSANAA